MLLVDQRHPHPGLSHERFCRAFSGLALSAPLELGDINFWAHGGSGVCIEVKKPKDVLNSIAHSGRLIQQLRNARTGSFRWWYVLVLEGFKRTEPNQEGDFCQWQWGEGASGHRKYRLIPVMPPGTKQPISYRRVDNWLNTLRLVEGVPVKETANEAETVAVITNLYHWFSKPLDEHLSTVADAEYQPLWLGPSGKVPLVREWAAKLPGVGVRRSKAVMAVFPTALAMAEGTVEDWKRVEGVGRGMAAKVWAEIRKNGVNGQGTGSP